MKRIYRNFSIPEIEYYMCTKFSDINVARGLNEFNK